MTGKNSSTDYVALAGIALVGFAAWKLADLFKGDDDASDSSRPPGTQTLTDVQVKSIADAIDWAFRGVAEDEGEVIRQLMKANTAVDVWAITKAFGSRRLLFGLSGPFTLPAAVSQYLSASDIERINADYRAKGINFAF